jgi:hypothetical protein
MRAYITALVVGLGMLAATSAGAQQVEIESQKQPVERPARVVPPPLHYETTRPPDTDYYPQGTKVEHDPAFIEPLASKYETPTGSGRVGVSGSPVGGWRDVSGWFALGFSITWDGPPAPKARPR